VPEGRINICSKRQTGGVMVEFAVSMSLFILMVLAIFEFVLLIMTYSRANEVTRDVARMAIVRDPVSEVCGDLSAGGPMLERAQAHLPAVTGNQIRICYNEADTGVASSPFPVYLVTVELQGVQHELLFPTLLGLNSQFNMPAFTTSRTSEDLSTANKPQL